MRIHKWNKYQIGFTQSVHYNLTLIISGLSSIRTSLYPDSLAPGPHCTDVLDEPKLFCSGSKSARCPVCPWRANKKSRPNFATDPFSLLKGIGAQLIWRGHIFARFFLSPTPPDSFHFKACLGQKRLKKAMSKAPWDFFLIFGSKTASRVLLWEEKGHWVKFMLEHRWPGGGDS